MDHNYIEDNALVDRYFRGLLEPEEEARFEAHFVTCDSCMEQLELARGFEKGIKALSAQAAEQALQAAVVQAGLFAWLARRGRLAGWGMALAALLLAAGLPSLWLAAKARTEQTAAARGMEDLKKASADLKRRLAESEERRSQELQDLQAKLALAQRPALPPPEAVARPLGSLAVVLLTAARGEEAPARVVLPGSGELVALAVDAGSDPRFVSYRATLTRVGGGTVYRQDGLKPNALETLMLTFPTGYFQPGQRYRLRIEGVPAQGEAVEIGGYPFQTVTP